MVSILQGVSNTKHTFRTILNSPVAPLKHVFGVNPVHDDKPSKNLNLESAETSPDPFQQWVGLDWRVNQVVVLFSYIFSLCPFFPGPNITVTSEIITI